MGLFFVAVSLDMASIHWRCHPCGCGCVVGGLVLRSLADLWAALCAGAFSGFHNDLRVPFSQWTPRHCGTQLCLFLGDLVAVEGV